MGIKLSFHYWTNQITVYNFLEERNRISLRSEIHSGKKRRSKRKSIKLYISILIFIKSIKNSKLNTENMKYYYRCVM